MRTACKHGAMNIVLFAVCALFGVSTIVLWAALSSARLRLSHVESLLKTVYDIVQTERALGAAERAELASKMGALFEEPAPRG